MPARAAPNWRAALRLGAAAFRAGMEGCPAFRGLLLRYALAFHTQVTATAACNARHAVERRLARWLLIAHDRAGADEFPMRGQNTKVG